MVVMVTLTFMGTPVVVVMVVVMVASSPSLTPCLPRLTLATFDDEGHCIGHMGSWSFSS